MRRLILFGARSPLVPDYEETCARTEIEIVAIVRSDELLPRSLDRNKIVDLSDIHDTLVGQAFIACAFSPQRRAELVELAVRARLVPAEPLVDSSAAVASSTRIGRGTFINAGVVIGAAGLIGDHVVTNRSSNIGHHSVIGEFASIGPGVTIAGNVRIGDRSFVGAGSVILPGVRVGDGAAIAAGSVVKEDVPNDVLAAGNPASVRRRRPSPEMFAAAGEE